MMKTAAIVASAALAVAVAEETCDYSVVKPYFHQISDSMAACESSTSIDLQSGSVLSLTSDEQSEICSDCTEMVELVYTFTWYDCEIEIDGANQTLSTYYETLVGSCGNSSDGSNSTTATISASSTEGTSTITSSSSDTTAATSTGSTTTTTAGSSTTTSSGSSATTTEASGSSTATASSSNSAVTVISSVSAAACALAALALM